MIKRIKMFYENFTEWNYVLKNWMNDNEFFLLIPIENKWMIMSFFYESL